SPRTSARPNGAACYTTVPSPPRWWIGSCTTATSTTSRARATGSGASRAPRSPTSHRRSRSRRRARTARMRIPRDPPQAELTEGDGTFSTRTPANPWHIDNENLQESGKRSPGRERDRLEGGAGGGTARGEAAGGTLLEG